MFVLTKTSEGQILKFSARLRVVLSDEEVQELHALLADSCDGCLCCERSVERFANRADYNIDYKEDNER